MNNIVRKKRDAINLEIDKKAKKTGKPKEEIALQYIESNVPELETYVRKQGERPLKNPVELAVQVYKLREKQISELIQAGYSRDAAEVYLDNQENDSVMSTSAEADSFIGSIIGAVGTVAVKGIDRIRDKRISKGKPTKVWDFLSKNLGGNAADENTPLPQQQNRSGFSVVANDLISEIERRRTKEKIKELMPYIIIGIVAIIVITLSIKKK